MRTLVRGGCVVTEGGCDIADILVSGEIVEGIDDRIDPSLADTVYEAHGKYVLPGFIDPHVHSRDPGHTHKEDFAHSTRGALLAGVSTVLEMPNASPPLTSPSAVLPRAQYLATRAYTDFGLWALVLGNEDYRQLEAFRSAGVVAAKLFWGYSFDKKTMSLVYGSDQHTDNLIPPADNGAVWTLLHEAKRAGLLIGFHCEDRPIVQAAGRRLGPVGDPDGLTRSRPACAEAAAVAALVEMARDVGARAHVVHVSSEPTVNLLRTAQASGVQITSETCPHYLTLSPRSDAGSDLKVYPPVRDAQHATALWAALDDGVIQTIGSDHAPHSHEERSGPFESQPAGLVGVQTSTRVLLDAVHSGRLTIQQLSQVMSGNTAKIFGLHPRKGVLQAGADADLVIVDLDAPWTIRSEDLASKNTASPWVGWTGHGVPAALFVRGRLAMSDGTVHGGPQGRWITPRPCQTSDLAASDGRR